MPARSYALKLASFEQLPKEITLFTVYQSQKWEKAMLKARFICTAFLFFVILASVASGEFASDKNPYESAVVTARSEVWRAINRGKCGSASVAIMVDGRIVYSEGFGMAQREKSIPVDAKTLFNMGSISKVYVAAAIMLLVDDGKVSPDTPVTEYLPEFKMADDRYKKITVRMLLNHTSGLPGTQGANSFGFRYDDNIKQETLDTLARAHLKHDPGAMSVYCNDGFTLAEMIVERVGNQKYMEFLEKRIFQPLGIKNTHMGVGEVGNKPTAWYYDPETGKKHPLETLSVLGAGGLSSTAEDLCFFADAFSAEGGLLTPASLAEMKKPQPAASWGRLRHPDAACGLGWDFVGFPGYDEAGVRILGKSGGTGNYSSMVYTVPAKRMSVAVLASGSDSGAMKIALDVLDAVLVEEKLIPKKDESVAIPPQPQKLPEDHAAFGGYYADGTNLFQVVFDEEDNNAVLYFFNGHEKTPVKTLIYNAGYYYTTEGDRAYFTSMDGETYLVSFVAMVGLDTITKQKVKPMDTPLQLGIDMGDRVWLRRNVSPFESIMAVDSHFAKSRLYEDLPGYVFFEGLKRIDSPDRAGMPFDALRDQMELTLLEKDGVPWAWVSSLLYSSAESASVVEGGEHSVKVGSDGYNEWLVAGEDMVVSYTKPENGRVILFSPDGKAIHDSAIDAGDVYAAKGSYIQFAGFADEAFNVKARPVPSQSQHGIPSRTQTDVPPQTIHGASP